MGSRQPDWSAKPVLPRGTSGRVARSPPISNYLIFDNLLSLGSGRAAKAAGCNPARGLRAPRLVRLRHFPPLCPSGATGRRAVLRRLFLWVRIPSWTPWPAGQIGKGASLRRKRFSRFEAGAGHQVMPAYENRFIGGAQTSVFVRSNPTAGTMRA
jgi:hypothetical protein